MSQSAAARFGCHSDLIRETLDHLDKSELVRLLPVFLDEISSILYKECNIWKLRGIDPDGPRARSYYGFIRWLQAMNDLAADDFAADYLADFLSDRGLPESPSSGQAYIDGIFSLLPGLICLETSDEVSAKGDDQITRIWRVTVNHANKRNVHATTRYEVREMPDQSTDLLQGIPTSADFPGCNLTTTSTLDLSWLSLRGLGSPVPAGNDDVVPDDNGTGTDGEDGTSKRAALQQWLATPGSIPSAINGIVADDWSDVMAALRGCDNGQLTSIDITGHLCTLNIVEKIARAAPRLQSFSTRNYRYPPHARNSIPVDSLPKLLTLLAEACSELKTLKLSIHPPSSFGAAPSAGPLNWASGAAAGSRLDQLESVELEKFRHCSPEEESLIAHTLLQFTPKACTAKIFRRGQRAVLGSLGTNLMPWLRQRTPEQLRHLAGDFMRHLGMTTYLDLDLVPFTLSGRPLHSQLWHEMTATATGRQTIRNEWLASRRAWLAELKDVFNGVNSCVAPSEAPFVISYLNKRLLSVHRKAQEELEEILSLERSLLDGDVQDVGYDLGEEIAESLAFDQRHSLRE